MRRLLSQRIVKSTGEVTSVLLFSRGSMVGGKGREMRGKPLVNSKKISHHRYVYPTFFSWAYLAAGDLALTARCTNCDAFIR